MLWGADMAAESSSLPGFGSEVAQIMDSPWSPACPHVCWEISRVCWLIWLPFCSSRLWAFQNIASKEKHDGWEA